MLPGRGYWLKLGTQTVTATVQHPKYEINVNTLEHLAAPTLELNRSAWRDRDTTRDRFDRLRPGRPTQPTLGGFILIDKLTNATVGAG